LCWYLFHKMFGSRVWGDRGGQTKNAIFRFTRSAMCYTSYYYIITLQNLYLQIFTINYDCGNSVQLYLYSYNIYNTKLRGSLNRRSWWLLNRPSRPVHNDVELVYATYDLPQKSYIPRNVLNFFQFSTHKYSYVPTLIL